IAYKYTVEPGATYEGSHNRLLDMPSGSGSNVVAIPAYYNDTQPDGTPTTTVTFQVNLAQQINTGSFNTNSSLVYVRGSFNGWGTDVAMTNDPSIRTTNQFGLVSSNVYVAKYDIAGSSPGRTIDYKFYIDTGANWESFPTAGLGKDPND